MDEVTSHGPYGSLHLGNGTFGEAVKALQDGQRLQRSGWNGTGMFVFMQVPAVIPEAVVPNMQSLPQTVKDEFARRFKEAHDSPETQSESAYTISYSNQLALVGPTNIINGWAPSVSDALATDWKVLD